MDPKKGLEQLKQLGITVPARWVTILTVLGPLLLAAAAVAWVLWSKRKKTAAAPPPVELRADASAPPTLGARQLRKAWLRFLGSLPTIYRRSILNFDHFVVLGAASVGKSRVIDLYSDWRRQAKHFLQSQSFDPDLQVYLGSGSVVTELPARIALDHGAACRRALERLWRPLYRRRSPTVVVVVDAVRLRDAVADDVVDLADRLRGKIDLLAAIRGRAVEVRVVLTHLDEWPGFDELGALCREEGIPLVIPWDSSPDAPRGPKQITDWLEAARGHLPRALVKRSSADFRKIVQFLRRAPEIAPSLARFVEALFAHDPIARDPLPGGIHLATEPAAAPNPLVHVETPAPGPDPRVRHAALAIAAATLVVGYLTAAYREQRVAADAATHALEQYDPSAVGTDPERARRQAIGAFAWNSRGLLQHAPDYFAAARAKLRDQFSATVRQGTLVPRLRTVAQRGVLEEGELPSPWRRSLYFLALIHDGRRDAMHILEPQRLAIWSKMTDLEPELIRDYLASTDEAWREPVAFDLAGRDIDARDTVAFWASFLHDLEEATASGSIRRADLVALQTRAADLAAAIDRFEHDDVTGAILANLAEATGWATSKDPGVARMRDAYTERYGGFLANVAASDVFGQREAMRDVLRRVAEAKIEPTRATTADELDTRLRAIAAAPLDPTATRVISLKLAGQEYTFDAKRWAEALREGSASEQVAAFLRPRSEEDRSIFFGAGKDEDLRPVTWNAANDGTALFVGKGTIDARYSRGAYDKHVREPVLRLGEALGKVKLADDLQQSLRSLVRDQVKAYAGEYAAQLVRFFRSFGVRASSQEELRVVLAQMVADTSPFADFVAAVDRQVAVQADAPELEPMGEALADFAGLHRVLDASSGAAEIGKYREILRQMLGDLGPADPTAPPAASASEPPTLEKTLTQVGQLVLKSVRGEKGAYPPMVRDWLASVHLPDWQQLPFLAPVDALVRIGLVDIDREVNRVWNRDMIPELSRLADKFPFDATATEEVSPDDLEALFHPQRGRFFDLFRRFFEPVSGVSDGRPFEELPSLKGRISYPTRMYPVVNAVAGLSSRLWDATGRATPIDVKIGTVAFEQGSNANAVPTLAFLSVGDVSVFNFNQKPAVSTLRYDWVHEQPAQVGVQLTNVDTKEQQIPRPIAVDPSHWSLVRLLSLAEARPAKQPKDATVYTWSVGPANDPVHVRYLVLGAPFDAFGVVAQLVKGPKPAKAAE